MKKIIEQYNQDKKKDEDTSQTISQPSTSKTKNNLDKKNAPETVSKI